MTVLPFADWKPDLSPYKAASSQLIQNVFPRLDGYGPVASVSPYSQALPAPCRGYFYARKADQSVTVFAATASKLYKLNNTDFSWTDVSKGAGSYTAVGNGEQWQFAQFNNFVIAVQINTVPQVFDLTSSTAFADLGGSPPPARYVAVVNRFVVLSGLGTSTPYRVQWSGLNAVTTWTSGVNSSDFQDLPDGGVVRAIGGGETGLITQDASLRAHDFCARCALRIPDRPRGAGQGNFRAAVVGARRRSPLLLRQRRLLHDPAGRLSRPHRQGALRPHVLRRRRCRPAAPRDRRQRSARHARLLDL